MKSNSYSSQRENLKWCYRFYFLQLAIGQTAPNINRLLNQIYPSDAQLAGKILTFLDGAFSLFKNQE